MNKISAMSKGQSKIGFKKLKLRLLEMIPAIKPIKINKTFLQLKTDLNISKNSNISFYPIGLSYITDSDKEQIEFGGGMTVLNGVLEKNGEEIDPDARMIFFGAGYRYHFQEIGVLLGLKGYYLSLDGLGAPWAGITLGWSF